MIGRTRRRRAPADSGGSIEFAELLDPVVVTDAPCSVEPDEPVEVIASVEAVERAEDVEVVEAVEVIEVIELSEPVEALQEIQPVDVPLPAPITTHSRFADAGLNDDRLPVRKPKRRWLHR